METLLQGRQAMHHLGGSGIPSALPSLSSAAPIHHQMPLSTVLPKDTVA